ALGVVQKLAAVNDVVGAGVVVDLEGPAAALDHEQVVENIAGALGAVVKPPAGGGGFARLRHENAVVPAAANRHVFKHIVARIPHENARVVAGENRAVNDIMGETQVERDSRRQVVVQVQAAEMAVLGPVTGQAVELIVEGGEIPHRQTARPPGGHQAAGAATAAGDMLDNAVVRV